jgi:hypothetical protein
MLNILLFLKAQIVIFRNERERQYSTSRFACRGDLFGRRVRTESRAGPRGSSVFSLTTLIRPAATFSTRFVFDRTTLTRLSATLSRSDGRGTGSRERRNYGAAVKPDSQGAGSIRHLTFNSSPRSRQRGNPRRGQPNFLKKYVA